MILQGVDRLMLSDREVERRAGSNTGQLSLARQGRKEGPKNGPWWEALARVAAVVPTPPEGTLPASAGKSRAVAPRAPAKRSAATEAAEDLARALRAADSLEKLDRVAGELVEAAALEELAPAVSRVCLDILKERRQVLVAMQEEAARGAANRPLEMTVRYIGAEWKG